MDLRILSLGERIAAACGAALFVLLFLPTWLEGQSAWEALSIVDVLIALLAVVTVALPLARATGTEPPFSPSTKQIVTRIGFVVLVVTVTLILEGDEPGIGIFLSLLATGGLLYGAITMPGEEGPARRRDRTRRPIAEEDYEEPPPGMESWREGGLYAEAEEGPVVSAPRGGSGDEPGSPRDRDDSEDLHPRRGGQAGEEPGPSAASDADDARPRRGPAPSETQMPTEERPRRAVTPAEPEPPEWTDVRGSRRSPDVDR